jgi:hypothetical protein
MDIEQISKPTRGYIGLKEFAVGIWVMMVVGVHHLHVSLCLCSHCQGKIGCKYQSHALHRLRVWQPMLVYLTNHLLETVLL